MKFLKIFTWDLLGLPPRTHRSRMHSNCVLPDYKMRETDKGKNCRVTVNYMSYLLRIIIGAGKK